MTNKNEDIIEIDLLRLMRALWNRVLLIVLAAVLGGALMLAYTAYMVTPMYEAEALMYVNSSNISLGGTKLNISQGELNAAQSLISTYSVILKTRTTLNDVIEESGLAYTYESLSKMITAEAVNDTEVFRITVTSAHPQNAAILANTIAQVLPEKIASIVEGSSARIVDMAVVPAVPTSPSYTKNVILGALVGMLLACAVVVIRELMDDMIYDSDYLLQTYDIPVLATIPDLLIERSSGKYYYSSAPKKSGHQ